MFRVTGLSCEYKMNPVGIDVARPRFGWRLESDERAAIQTAYRIQVTEDPAFERIVWDSGKTASDRNVHVEAGDIAPQSRKRYHYRVMAWDRKDRPSDWSEPGYWETGLLDASEWSASWIATSEELAAADPDRCPMLRKAFRIDGRIREARIYATALGLYELTLNGSRVGDRYFTPGWTSYRKRLQYQTYDVTSLLREGENVIGGLLGKGWYKGEIGWEGEKGKYGELLALLVQMHVTLEDGTEWMLETDGTWKAAPSPILMSEIYHGETYDAGQEQPGWNAPGFDDRSWSLVEVIEHSKSILTAQENEPVQAVETIVPIALIKTPEGDTVLDFGQNMVGWVRFNVNGDIGEEVMLQHAEVLDRDGNFYTENLRNAKQTARYILRGGGRETFEPHFSFQGFRYVRLTGFREPISLDDFEGIVLHTNMQPTGQFQCSNSMINQLQHNILWGLKGNFLDVPTDCPQRDERLGWTGDAQMFIRTAAYLMNVNPFFTKWLRDLKADQAPDGGVPFVVPHVLKPTSYSSAAWGDAAVICPWTLYLVYGDTRILEEQYESMKSWVEYMRAAGEDEFLWNTGFHFGDWLGLDAKPDSYIGATDKDYIATAFYAHSVSILQKTAALLNKQADAEAYSVLRDRILEAFESEFVTPSGRLSVPTQTAQVLGLTFGLLRGKAKERAVRKLMELLEESQFHLTTGFVGTPYLNHALSENGQTEAAYGLLFQQDYPSWLYQVTKGATTVWEHWDGIREDGSFWSRDMNSFNHYAYGAIGDWLYRCVAGIDTDENAPGYKRILIRPQPPAEGLDWADGRLETMHGTVRSAWRRREDGKMELQATIPPNTTAEIRLPGAAADSTAESGMPVRSAAGIVFVEEFDGVLILSVGSGNYTFVW